jgi:hypothetical protein
MSDAAMNKPELLSPAGTLRNMRYAFAWRRRRYAGQPRYSLRVRNNEFNKEEVLAQGIAEAHPRQPFSWPATWRPQQQGEDLPGRSRAHRGAGRTP